MGHFRYWTSRDRTKRVIKNAIASEGHVAALDALLQGSGNIGNLFIGLIDGAIGAPTSFQTLADKDWNEFTNYTEADRQLWNRAAVVGQDVPNEECNPTVFTMAVDPTLNGFFITDTNLKGDTVGKFLAYSNQPLSFPLYQHDRLFLEYTWKFSIV